MGSPLGVFLVYFENNWLQNCPSDFTSPEYLETFPNFLDGGHANM